MQKVKMSGKGQVVIPAEIRRKLSIKPGEMVFVEEESGVIKIKPKTKLRSLCGTWPELDIETITREIIEDREQDAKIEKEREKQIEMQEMKRKKRKSNE
ncbi:MAG: AbrB/MazE/SpoVT family DNA-binding domain-containing protein [Euryarchaeota archaeon]|nr:AbrB/MazE/SpoVT family DNA-binding domain-containing protein [Euryarchaeota archaeon]